MSTPMMNQAGAVLDALAEGTVYGMFIGIKDVCPGASKEWILAKMRSLSSLSQEDFDYWVDWLGLERS